MMKEIAREEIKNWPLGNVMIKTFSYGDKLRLAGSLKKIFKDVNLIKNEQDEQKIMDNLKDDIDLAEVNIDLVIAGLFTVKNFDGMNYIIKPDSSREEKIKFVYNLDFELGQYLLTQIMLLNKPLGDEVKKESS
jgi:hypothetical protein